MLDTAPALRIETLWSADVETPATLYVAARVEMRPDGATVLDQNHRHLLDLEGDQTPEFWTNARGMQRVRFRFGGATVTESEACACGGTRIVPL